MLLRAFLVFERCVVLSFADTSTVPMPSGFFHILLLLFYITTLCYRESGLVPLFSRPFCLLHHAFESNGQTW
ncbi:hypothetical protein M758_7G022300 [Ceratodon purpureus]|uniref:Uncharacterized protein n=1 Tax=Ceratodon purpureus TaxID=3225 RepID=A0A8T0H6A3_CERPU|nr:hypothetical protein KC19_7G023100 [Ceratodon purpureus]KAG0609899.1 hypothetical protein M758_7G022300 [Ceratodon purpureus]